MNLHNLRRHARLVKRKKRLVFKRKPYFYKKNSKPLLKAKRREKNK